MHKKSAGILLYRLHDGVPEVFLVHPGGPFWVKKDAGAWTIPKGEIEENENAFTGAKRELEEETGIKVSGDFIELAPLKQNSNKKIYAWALLFDVDPSAVTSNTFELEWPPKSGIKKSFPEIDKAAWFHMDEAKKKIIKGQIPLIKELESKLNANR